MSSSSSQASHLYRRLRVPTPKQIYSLSSTELCRSLRSAARRKIQHPELWDAFLYRACYLKADFQPSELAGIFDALGSNRLDYLGGREMVRREGRGHKSLVKESA